MVRSLAQVVVALIVAGLLAGCAMAGSSPTPSPGNSKACGGYHLAIENLAGTTISVEFNGQHITNVASGTTADIAQWGVFAVPSMPWNIEISRADDASILLALRLVDDGMDGRRLTVVDPPAPTPDLMAYLCAEQSAYALEVR